MGSPLLSICIPTYNRPKEFERMLTGVLDQFTEDAKKHVEIFVRDDSTTLASQEIFNKLIEGTGIQHKYVKGEKIGLDAANLYSIEHANGDFIWWFSDDDEMQPNALGAVLDILRTSPDLTYIWINFSYDEIHRISVERESGFFRDRNDVLESLGVNFGLVTTHLFKREIAKHSLKIAQKHIVGFSFAGLIPILHVLSNPGKFYFLKGPYILCHPTTTEEVKQIATRTGKIKNEAFNIYGIQFNRVIREYEQHFSRHAVRTILALNFSSLWRGMLVGWMGGWDTPIGKRWAMTKLYWTFPEYWLAMPAFLLPLWFNKALYKIYKIFFHERKFIFFRDDKNTGRT